MADSMHDIEIDTDKEICLLGSCCMILVAEDHCTLSSSVAGCTDCRT